jgi:DsbC/DsbD-like thiol-disulfide interchange protein
MNFDFRSIHLWRGLAAASLLAVGSSAAFAADASPWNEDVQSGARLIAARPHGDPANRVFRAGVEIKLKEGWKTYWRYPGDSGVPPILDFSKSQNVKSVTVLFPAPSRFPDGAGGTSIGYKGDIVLPLQIVPKDAAKPITLNLKLEYAACEKLCVPAEASLELSLNGTETANEGLVSAAEQRVPKAAKVGDSGTPAIRAVHREATSGKPRIVVDVAAPAGIKPVLFAEGPTAEWALPLPEPVAGAPAGQQRFSFELDGLPPGLKKADGAALRLTAVAGDKAVEAVFRLD